jgi:hypothetical protein
MKFSFPELKNVSLEPLESDSNGFLMVYVGIQIF